MLRESHPGRTAVQGTNDCSAMRCTMSLVQAFKIAHRLTSEKSLHVLDIIGENGVTLAKRRSQIALRVSPPFKA